MLIAELLEFCIHIILWEIHVTSQHLDSNFNMKAIEKFIGNSTEILSDLKDKLSNLEIWSESSLDNTLTEYRNEKELSVPKVNQPIRIALTGSTNSPSLGLTMFLFEKEEVIKRINDLIKFVQANN